MFDTQSTWHVITGEYPPQPGGVSDYTYLVAQALADCGDEVHVWCPRYTGPTPEARGVIVHRELGTISPGDLRRAGKVLNQFPGPRRLLVQWVPHAYGCRSMNLPFCAWLWNRAARHGDQVEIMAHEPFLAFGRGSWRHNTIAFVQRLMAMIVLGAADHVWVSIPKWEERLRPYVLGKKIEFKWLPIPSNIPVVRNPDRIQQIRSRYCKDGLLVGHFGTYGAPIVDLLEPILDRVFAEGRAQPVLLMGRRSEQFRDRLIRRKPQAASWVHATGPLPAGELSCHISACDLLVQPYPDGVSARRGSFMAGLSHGKAVVSTDGRLTEPLWVQTGAVALAPAGATDEFVAICRRLLDDAGERYRMEQAAVNLYAQHLDVSHTAAALRRAEALVTHSACGS